MEAEQFAFENPSEGFKRVLLHIHWKDATSHYSMDKGAYSHEEEILLFDGISYQVLSVQDTEYKQYKVEEQIKFSTIPLIVKKGTLV